jgi:hypothetical protein
MHPQDSSARPDPPQQLVHDQQVQLTVLGFVLDEAPVTDPELERALVQDLGSFGELDDYRRAVHDLILSGVLRREGDQLWPTRPCRLIAVIGGIND